MLDGIRVYFVDAGCFGEDGVCIGFFFNGSKRMCCVYRIIGRDGIAVFLLSDFCATGALVF